MRPLSASELRDLETWWRGADPQSSLEEFARELALPCNRFHASIYRKPSSVRIRRLAQKERSIARRWLAQEGARA